METFSLAAFSPFTNKFPFFFLQKHIPLFAFFILFFLFWPHPWHAEVPGPGIEPAVTQSFNFFLKSESKLGAS